MLWQHSFGDKKFRITKQKGFQNPNEDRFMGEIMSPRMKRPKFFNYGKNKSFAIQDMTNMFNNEASRAKDKYDNQQKQKLVQENVDKFVKKGDIFGTSWGYDQTQNNYYQVIEVKGKSAYIKPINKTRVSDDSVKPVKDSFKTNDVFVRDSKKPVRKLIQVHTWDDKIEPYIRVGDHSASKWDGGENYETPYGFGH